MRAMLGGLGHTSFVGSNGNLRGPAAAAGVLSVFLFFLPALAVRGSAKPTASIASTATPRRLRIELKRKSDISISSCSRAQRSERHHFPGTTVSFMLSRFLWQLSQNAMLFTWSFTSRSGCADAWG